MTCSSSDCPKMGERGVHRHRSTFSEPPEGRKTPVSPTERATCSLEAWPGHNPQRPAGSSHAVTIWLVWWKELHRPRASRGQAAGRTKGTDGSVEGTITGRDFGAGVEDFFFFFFPVPLFSDVETTQCEEEDRSRQDTETDRGAGVLSSTRSERVVKTEIQTWRWLNGGVNVKFISIYVGINFRLRLGMTQDEMFCDASPTTAWLNPNAHPLDLSGRESFSCSDASIVSGETHVVRWATIIKNNNVFEWYFWPVLIKQWFNTFFLLL